MTEQEGDVKKDWEKAARKVEYTEMLCHGSQEKEIFQERRSSKLSNDAQ